MQIFGDQTAIPIPLEKVEAKGPAPDDPSAAEPEEVPEVVRVPEGVSEADFLEQNLPA